MCGKTWSRERTEPAHSCPGCGDPNWDKEPEFSQFLSGPKEWDVVAEHEDPNLILTLELSWSIRSPNSSSWTQQARLPHRMKSMYRHQTADLLAKSPGPLQVWFEKVGDQWGMHVIRRRSK